MRDQRGGRGDRQIDDMAMFLPIWTFTLSVVTGLAYLWDKQMAIRGGRRIREKTLLGLCLLGGWPGGLVAGRWMRHKTLKTSYRVKFAACAALNIAVMLLLLAW